MPDTNYIPEVGESVAFQPRPCRKGQRGKGKIKAVTVTVSAEDVRKMVWSQIDTIASECNWMRIGVEIGCSTLDELHDLIDKPQYLGLYLPIYEDRLRFVLDNLCDRAKHIDETCSVVFGDLRKVMETTALGASEGTSDAVYEIWRRYKGATAEYDAAAKAGAPSDDAARRMDEIEEQLVVAQPRSLRDILTKLEYIAEVERYAEDLASEEGARLVAPRTAMALIDSIKAMLADGKDEIRA